MIESPASALALVLVGLVGYFVGSISSGYLVGKIYRNVDLRNVGSGSTGATNTFRTLGRGAGLLVALLDIVKGIVAVWIAPELEPQGADYQRLSASLAAIGAVAAHCWPITL